MILSHVPFDALAAEVWPGMPEWRFRCWCTYLRQLAWVMALRDWHLTLKRSPLGEDDAHARVDVTTCRKTAIIQLAEVFPRLPVSEQTHVLVHELAHCYSDGLVEYLSDVLRGDGHPGLLSGPAWTAVYHAMRQHVEGFTDMIADALAPLVDAPEWYVSPNVEMVTYDLGAGADVEDGDDVWSACRP